MAFGEKKIGKERERNIEGKTSFGETFIKIIFVRSFQYFWLIIFSRFITCFSISSSSSVALLLAQLRVRVLMCVCCWVWVCWCACVCGWVFVCGCGWVCVHVRVDVQCSSRFARFIGSNRIQCLNGDSVQSEKQPTSKTQTDQNQYKILPRKVLLSQLE